MRYEGHAFHEDFNGGKASGTLSLSREGIQFRNEEAECLLPLSGLNVELGGASNRIVFMNHPSIDGWKLYTSDQSILKDPIFENNVHLKNQAKKVRNTKRMALAFGLVIFGLIFGGLALGWTFKDKMVHTAAQQVPSDWEQKLGESAYAQFSSGQNILDDEKTKDYLDNLLEPLIDVAANERFNYTFHVIEDSTLNAAAFPGGNMIIHTGLILRLESSEQLLGVLAHEMAHVNQRHSIQSLINNAGLYLVLDAMVGGVGALSGVVLNGGSQLLFLKNSREHERDADEVGWSYLVDAKINPEGLIQSFEIMEKSMDDLSKEHSKILSFMSTHPALKERIDYLNKKIEEDPTVKEVAPLDFDYKSFQQHIRQSLNISSSDDGDNNTTTGSTKEEHNEN